MSISAATEKRLLTADEHDLVAKSHYPHVSALDREALAEARRRLRTFRDKARDVSRHQRREMRGKADPRGAKPASDNSGTEMKRRVFASALKRVNRELARFAAAERQPGQADIARRALEMKRANRVSHRPSATPTADDGMTAKPSDRSPVEANPMEAGRVSQFVKNAQARRDS